MKYGFEQMQIHRINVDTRMDNVASVRLMSRLGFAHEGVRRECVRSHDGTYQSLGLHGILQQEYEGRCFDRSRLIGPAQQGGDQPAAGSAACTCRTLAKGIEATISSAAPKKTPR